MKMTKKVRYGLRAMIEINLNETSVGILQKEISANQESRPPGEISVYDIYRAFEPELTVVNCECPGNICNRIDICPAKDYWSDLNTVIKNQMNSSTLDQIVKRNETLVNMN